MSAAAERLHRLHGLVTSEHGLTVFDAETQETSYGTLAVEGLPLIFDTHRKGGSFVSTVELLTETVQPVSVKPEEIERFCRYVPRWGLLAIPYSACFFKGNLHVYAYSGRVRGLDLAAGGGSVSSAERNLEVGVRSIWSRIPAGVLRAQHDLLRGIRKARYDADLEVLRARRMEEDARRSPRMSSRDGNQ